MVLSKMNNHEHRTKQTYESYTFQPLMGFWSHLIDVILGSTERQTLSFRKSVREVPYRHTKKTVDTLLLDFVVYELLTAVKSILLQQETAIKHDGASVLLLFLYPFPVDQRR